MNINTKFAVSVHLLALLSFRRKTQIFSDLLAQSVNTNPVVIRRLISRLRKADLVETKVGGGYELTRPAGEINLLDVYRAVTSKEGGLLHMHANPNPACFVGRNIHDALEMPMVKANLAMQQSLKSTSIADIAAFIRDRENAA